jgi:hypothetical protein
LKKILGHLDSDLFAIMLVGVTETDQPANVFLAELGFGIENSVI